MGVFLAYASAKGRVLLDRDLYLPQVWVDDWGRRQKAGVPESVGFQTKGQLVQRTSVLVRLERIWKNW